MGWMAPQRQGAWMLALGHWPAESAGGHGGERPPSAGRAIPAGSPSSTASSAGWWSPSPPCWAPLLVLKVRTCLPFLLAFAAGAMIYVVVEELIPESQTNENKDWMALFTLVGFSVMMVMDVALG